MNSDHNNEQKPAVPLSLELEAALYRTLQADAQLYQTLESALHEAVASLMGDLGIPGDVVVQISPFERKAVYSAQFMRVHLHHRLCRYSDELLRYVHSYVNSCPLHLHATPANLLFWLTALVSETDTASHDCGLFVEFIVQACMEVIKEKPGVLLGDEQVAEYIASLSETLDKAQLSPNDALFKSVELRPALKKVLDMKISLADTLSVGKVLLNAAERSWEEITEDLIETLGCDSIEIQLPEEDLRQITSFDQENGPNKFQFLREGLFEELGMRYPALRFVPVHTLKAGSFAFKVQHVTMLPLVGLAADRCLINGTSSSIASMGIEGQSTMNPASALEGSIIALALHDMAELYGFTAWNQIEYLILCIAACLRMNGACFVHKTFVQQQFDLLSPYYPELITAVTSAISLARITRILRALVVEEVSIQNLKQILEILAEYGYDAGYQPVADATDVSSTLSQQVSSIQHAELADLVMLVRSGMKRQIKQKCSNNTGTVVVYLVQQEIEEMASILLNRAPDTLADAQREEQLDEILNGIRQELTHLPPTAQLPVLLATERARLPLFTAIHAELPRMTVLCYADLPEDTNIQPVARIMLPA